MQSLREICSGNILTAVVACFLWFASIDLAHSQYTWKLVEGPIYNPHTKSYFEFRRVPNPALGGVSWADAANRVSRLTYKGTNGRLAIVRDVETHEFLLQFPLKAPTWIGLRLDCSTRELYWVDGSTLEKKDFHAWDLSQWYLTENIRCSKSNNINHMGVFYQSRKDFRWQAAGQEKLFDYFLIEYPTGSR